MTRSSDQNRRRSTARLAAAQALYQIETANSLPRFVIEEFLAHRLDAEIDGVAYADADADFFTDLVRGVHERMAEIDGHLEGALGGTWTVARLDRTARQILRAGVYELLARVDVPTAVIINEYVDVARAFFDGAEPGFVNGVLDTLGRSLRAGPAAGVVTNP